MKNEVESRIAASKALGLLFKLLLLCGVVLSSNAVADCNALIAGGVWDIQKNHSASLEEASFLNWFCSRGYGSEQSARNDGINIGFVYDGLPVQVGAYDRRSDWKTYYAEMCSMESGRYAHAQEVSQLVKTASPVLLGAYQSCINRPGLHASFRVGSDPKLVVIDVSYLGLRPDDKISKPTISWNPEDSLVCTQQTSPYRAGSPIDIAGLRYLQCTRRDVKQQINVTVEDKKLVFNPETLVIPGIDPPAVPKCPGDTKEFRNSGVYSAGIEFNAGECPVSLDMSAEHTSVDGRGDHTTTVEIVYVIEGQQQQQYCYKSTGPNRDRNNRIVCGTGSEHSPLSVKPFQRIRVEARAGDSPGSRSENTLLVMKSN